MSDKYVVFSNQITRDKLQDLRIRVQAFQTPGSLAAYAIGQAGLDKLREAGYVVSTMSRLAQEGPDVFYTAVLYNPDKLLAQADLDPRDILVVQVLTQGLPNFTDTRSFWEDIGRSLSAAYRQHVDIHFASVDTSSRQFTPPASNGLSPKLTIVVGAAGPGQDRYPLVWLPSPMQFLGVNEESPTVLGLTVPKAHINAVATTASRVPVGGRPIYSPEGVELGNYVEEVKAIYIYNRWHNQGLGEIVRPIIQAVVNFCVQAAVAGEVGQFSPELVQTQFQDIARKRHEQQQKEHADAIKHATIELEKHAKQTVRLVRERERSLLQLASLAVNVDDTATQYQEVLGLAHVERAYWRFGFLFVETDMLSVVDPRDDIERELGRYLIRIGVDGEQAGNVKFLNRTRLISGMNANMHAPHVFEDGRPCLGSLGETLPILVAQYQWVTAVELCLAFLTSVNTNDAAGKHVHKWPRKRVAAVAASPAELDAELEAELEQLEHATDEEG